MVKELEDYTSFELEIELIRRKEQEQENLSKYNKFQDDIVNSIIKEYRDFTIVDLSKLPTGIGKHDIVRKIVNHDFFKKHMHIIASIFPAQYYSDYYNVICAEWYSNRNIIDMNKPYRPKIKIVHLLLVPTWSGDLPTEMWESRMRNQAASVECWRRIAPEFSSYVERYVYVNRDELPEEGCADPSIIDKSLNVILESKTHVKLPFGRNPRESTIFTPVDCHVRSGSAPVITK